MKDSKDLCLDATSERYSKVVQAFRDISPELSSPLEKKQELCVFHPMHLWQGIQRMNQQFHKREDRKTCKGWKKHAKKDGKTFLKTRGKLKETVKSTMAAPIWW